MTSVELAPEANPTVALVEDDPAMREHSPVMHAKDRRNLISRRRPVVSRTELERQLAQVKDQQSAISEVLRVIASSPDDLQPICETILDDATRLCRARWGTLRLIEEKGVRLVAHRGTRGASERWSPPILALHCSYVGRLAASKSPVHVPDLAAHELYRRGEPVTAGAVNIGRLRTCLFVPLLKDEEVIGSLGLARMRVQPFTDKEIELISDFAAQAAIALEITRRQRTYHKVRKELSHANRLATIGQLTASIAHELKQPLAAVVMNGGTVLRWLTRAKPKIDEAKDCAGRIIDDARRAIDIMQGLRDLTKKNAIRKQAFDLNDAILGVAALTHSEALKNGVTVRMQLAPRLPRIHGDRVQLQQVILNLIVNGIQAISEVAEDPRDLLIRTDRAEDGVRVAVQDSGPGLSPEKSERLFEPFYTTKPDGMGMGLSICHSIIEAHGGRLWATGHASRGALFQFTIPTRNALTSE